METALLPLIAALPLAAQAPAPERAWSNATTLSLVATSGNARGQNLGLEEAFGWRRDRSELSVKGRAVRVTDMVVERSAAGTSPDSYTYAERESSGVTAENFRVDTRFDQRFRDRPRYYWFAAAGWARDLPAGLDHHLEGLAGAGRVWVEDGRTRFRTDLGLGYTHETPRFARPRTRPGFATGNLTAQLRRRIGAAAYQADLAWGADLGDARDWQATLGQALSVSVSTHLALKVGCDLAYRAVPNLIPVPIQSLADPGVTVGTAGVPARRLDVTFTTGLMLTYK